MKRTGSNSLRVALFRKPEITLDKKQLEKLRPGKTLPKADGTVEWYANIGRCKREENVKVFMRWEGEGEENEGKGTKGEKEDKKGKEKQEVKEEKGPWCVFEWRSKGDDGKRAKLWAILKGYKVSFRKKNCPFPLVDAPPGLDDHDHEADDEEIGKEEEGEDERREQQPKDVGAASPLARWSKQAQSSSEDDSDDSMPSVQKILAKSRSEQQREDVPRPAPQASTSIKQAPSPRPAPQASTSSKQAMVTGSMQRLDAASLLSQKGRDSKTTSTKPRTSTARSITAAETSHAAKSKTSKKKEPQPALADDEEGEAGMGEGDEVVVDPSTLSEEARAVIIFQDSTT